MNLDLGIKFFIFVKVSGVYVAENAAHYTYGLLKDSLTRKAISSKNLMPV
jgi:hypothetical protein